MPKTKKTGKQQENNTGRASLFSGKKNHSVLLGRQSSTVTNACDVVVNLIEHVHLCTAFLALQFNDQQATLVVKM